jgi:flagellar motor switch/type III secretory pathway protein FliN
VSDPVLDPEELAAIQAAVRESAPAASRHRELSQEPSKLALIADDRSADGARPLLLELATRWSKTAPRALRGFLPGTWTLDVVGADVLDGPSAKAELRGAWLAAVSNDTTEVVVVAQGSVIDLAAARRCGAAAPTPDAARAPSAVSLRLFDPVGKAMTDSFVLAWREAFDTQLVPTKDLAVVQRLVEARTLVRATLALSDTVGGKIVILARPECLIAKTAPLTAHKANARLVANALANVQVELVAELGTLRMSLGDLRDLERGATHALPQFVDSRVPVFCEGVLKAWAKPVVSRGVLAVQIISVVHGQGTKS